MFHRFPNANPAPPAPVGQASRLSRAAKGAPPVAERSLPQERPPTFETAGTAVLRWPRCRASVLECGSPLPLSNAPQPIESGRGLPHSKTWRLFGRTSHNRDMVGVAPTTAPEAVALSNFLFPIQKRRGRCRPIAVTRRGYPNLVIIR